MRTDFVADPGVLAILNGHPTETLKVALNGSVLYANDRAVRLLNDDEIALEQRNFFDMWEEPSETVRRMIQNCAGSSQWLPMTLRIRSGDHAGARVAMLGRGFRANAAASVEALIVTDAGRGETFEEHRRLVRRLNKELAKHRNLELRLQETLDREQSLHQELIHRVKNNLALLSALIRTRADATDSAEAKEALNDIMSRTIAIGLVHEILDRTDATMHVDAKRMIEELCNQLDASICPKGVVIERDLASHMLRVSDATPLCLLVNELVTNALKHAFAGRDKGKVEVSLRRNGVDKLEVSVADNGGGLEDDKLERGSGARIIKALATQLRGELSMKSDAGVSWRLEFPPEESDNRNDADSPEA